MDFRVDLQRRALSDIDAIAGYLTTSLSVALSEKWTLGILEAIASLSQMPERCAIPPELEQLNRDVRMLLYGRRRRTYKVYFLVSIQPIPVVRILHVRHWARKPVEGEELEDLMDEQAGNA